MVNSIMTRFQGSTGIPEGVNKRGIIKKNHRLGKKTMVAWTNHIIWGKKIHKWVNDKSRK